MTIYRKDQFGLWLPADFDGVFEWDFLDGAFGPSIRPMDHDCVIERNGQFLVFETKQSGATLKTGPRIAFEAQQSLGCFTHVFLHFTVDGAERCQECGRVTQPPKHPDAITTMEIWKPGGQQTLPQRASSGDVRAFAERWFTYANTKTRAA
jgi:hypothetical protein